MKKTINNETYTKKEINMLFSLCKEDIREEENIDKIDFKKIMFLSIHHGVLPTVYKKLKHLNSKNSKETLSVAIKEMSPYCFRIAQKNMNNMAELIRINKLFNENNIEMMTFKGPTLAKNMYGDISSRQYEDLDILIKKKDIYKSDELMRKGGYEYFIPLSHNQKEEWIKRGHDIGYVNTKKRMYVEVHWNLLDDDYPLHLKMDSFWENKEKEIGDGISTFSNEYLLYYLCIHGSGHLWERIMWIKDIDMIIRKEDTDWDKFLVMTKESGFERMVFLGLYLANKKLETPLPDQVLSEINRTEKIKEISVFVLENIRKEKKGFEKILIKTNLFQTLAQKIVYLNKVILKPSSKEYLKINLPKGLYFGYYLVRPYMLMKKYMFGMWLFRKKSHK